MVFCCFFFLSILVCCRMYNIQSCHVFEHFWCLLWKLRHNHSTQESNACVCVCLSIYLSIHLYIQYIFSIICVHVVRKCLLYLQLDIFEGVRFTYATFIECVFEIDCCMSWLCNYFFEAGYYCWFAVTNVRQLSSLLAVCHRACLMHR